MYQVEKEIADSYGLNPLKIISRCTDGASSNLGKYNGLKSHHLKDNPYCIFVWCHSHR